MQVLLFRITGRFKVITDINDMLSLKVNTSRLKQMKIISKFMHVCIEREKKISAFYTKPA